MADDIIFRMKKDSLSIVREKEEYSSSLERDVQIIPKNK